MDNRCRLSYCRHSGSVHIFQADTNQAVCLTCQASNGVKPYLHEFQPQVTKLKHPIVGEELDEIIFKAKTEVEDEARSMAFNKKCPNCQSTDIKVGFFLLFFTGDRKMTCRKCSFSRTFRL